jgi:hypothetical protein
MRNSISNENIPALMLKQSFSVRLSWEQRQTLDKIAEQLRRRTGQNLDASDVIRGAIDAVERNQLLLRFPERT